METHSQIFMLLQQYFLRFFEGTLLQSTVHKVMIISSASPSRFTMIITLSRLANLQLQSHVDDYGGEFRFGSPIRQPPDDPRGAATDYPSTQSHQQQRNSRKPSGFYQ